MVSPAFIIVALDVGLLTNYSDIKRRSGHIYGRVREVVAALASGAHLLSFLIHLQAERLLEKQSSGRLPLPAAARRPRNCRFC